VGQFSVGVNIREALRLFEAYQSVQQSSIAALKADIEQGLSDVASGLEAWLFIAEDSFEAADHVLDILEKEVQTFALQPLMGRARPDLSVGIRCWPTSTSYNQYYIPEESDVIVVRVLHHARDIQSRDFLN
jgi:plasmid stabilization system protein ParE